VDVRWGRKIDTTISLQNRTTTTGANRPTTLSINIAQPAPLIGCRLSAFTETIVPEATSVCVLRGFFKEKLIVEKIIRYGAEESKSLMVVAMLLAGGFAGMAGATEVLGTYGYASTSLAGNIGFDAIAVALLGQSSPIGTLVSAVLFGALQAGGRSMQANTDVPVDLIIVLRALIVMFVAAPLLVKAMFRVKSQVTSQGQTFRGWGG
ncbi:MAG: ABC transporter permease subunit, partial [Acidimicrobiaceae bacterium]